MWVRLQLDFGWRDHAFGLAKLLDLQQPFPCKASIEKRFSVAGNALAVLSVRSGFDLLLGAMQWPADSEIVFSALNIPDMTMVARQHGIVPVPVDLDLDTLTPNLALLEKAITPKTKAILVAHLFGNLIPLESIAAIARKHGLLLIEDCAENYDGCYHGHPLADVSLFSFGPLKTATSLAGGVLRARDPDLFARLQTNHGNWPVQSRWDYCKRLSKYGAMKFFASKQIYPTVRKLGKMLVGNVDKLIHHTAKSFRDDEIMIRLRQRPCAPLLASMARRLARFDHRRLDERAANGRFLADLLRPHVFCPGVEAETHNFWVFPVQVSDPDLAISALEAAGFDATQVQSMRPIAAPSDRLDLDPLQTRQAHQKWILLPCYPGLPRTELKRMADALIAVEQQAGQLSALKVTLKPTDTQYGQPVTMDHRPAFAAHVSTAER